MSIVGIVEILGIGVLTIFLLISSMATINLSDNSGPIHTALSSKTSAIIELLVMLVFILGVIITNGRLL